MMLRSSSTPVLGSLLASSSSFSSSSHNDSDAPVELSHLGKLPAISRSSSAVSPSVIDAFHGKGGGGLGFRRVRSEGNLASDGNQIPPHVATRPRGSVKILDSIPSFSFYNAGREDEEEEDDEGSKVDDLDCGEVVRRNGVMSAGNFGSIVIDKKRDSFRQEAMYLAKGLGIHGNGGHDFCDYKGGFGGGSGRHGGLGSRSGKGGDGHGLDLEGYYEKMVEEDPGNPLFLGNYAQFLFKVKGDLEKAEEYYSRAMLTDPGDGEILCQYAKLVWKLRRDHIMASSYFERAARASPEDSRVQAAYARFLWDTEDGNNDDAQRGFNLEDYTDGHAPIEQAKKS